ncbi:hypothetical protein [Clostridium sp.]|uniref:hypothetical protein n=1 Tax=Clostridium sp. TaxID=1506 RepID=UPI0034646CC9
MINSFKINIDVLLQSTMIYNISSLDMVHLYLTDNIKRDMKDDLKKIPMFL